MRALLNGPHPIVIVGTLWPDRYNAYTAVPAPGATDPHAREREVLDLAAVIRISPQFSADEQDRARDAEARDPRLREALSVAGYGLTQILAAAPQLVARWEDAQTTDSYAWAVLTAALDAARLGARAPLSADLLRAAAPGYCTSAQRAEAPDNWFEQALAYATKKLHGAAARLAPAGTGMGQVAGYTVADYLLQHAARERRSSRVPASAWDALISHIRDPADAARLAGSAEGRLLYCYAIPLYRHAVDAVDRSAARQLVSLLAGCGDLDELQRPRRRRRQVRRPGSGRAAGRPRATWTRRCRSCAPARRRRRERRQAAGRPAGRAGDLDEAVQILRACADADDGTPPGGWPACWPAGTWTSCAPAPRRRRVRRPGLAGLLADRGDLTRRCRSCAPRRRRRRTRHQAAGRPAGRAGNLDEAVQILRARAEADAEAAGRLADLLAGRGDLDELRARADAGDECAAERLARLLAGRGDLDELRARADAGDGNAAGRPADLLAGRGTWTRPCRSCAPALMSATGTPGG